MINIDSTYWYKDAIIYQAHVRSFQDSNNDGIADAGYILYEDNVDNYPLMQPITEPVDISTIPEFPSLFILPLFVISIIAVIIGKMKLTNSS